MENQKLPSLPKEWEEKYWLKYIGMDEPLLLSKKTRDAVLQAMTAGTKFVQIKGYTIMVNSIQSIEPYYPPYNIPPRPGEDHWYIAATSLGENKLQQLWDETYADKKKQLLAGNV